MLRPALSVLFIAGMATTPATDHATVNFPLADTLELFPRVEGSNLEGQHFALPADFGAPLNVVFVAFKREQQGDVDTWTPFLKSASATRPSLRTFELPVLGRGYRLMRPFIDGGMRRGIPDVAVRAATITLYIDKGAFREALRIPDEDRIYVLLVDGQGRVLWRTAGRFDERAGAELLRRIDEPSAPGGDGD